MRSRATEQNVCRGGKCRALGATRHRMRQRGVTATSNQRRLRRGGPLSVLVLVCSLAACTSNAGGSSEPFIVSSDSGRSLRATPLARFDQPWAMSFMPDGRLLVTEKPGRLLLVTLGKDEPLIVEVGGLPAVRAAGQGGLGDVVLHPDFAVNRLVYVSYVEREGSRSGAAVARARLDDADGAPTLGEFEVIWRQQPKVTGSGHYGHRLAFAPDGHLFISSGERQKFTPAQDMDQNLGKLIRLRDDGSIPADNPFIADGGVTAEIWSIGHRNPLGLAFDADGQLWEHEMGPRGGDELNLVERGANYGYPLVSNGDHYSGISIPDHDTRPDLAAPAVSWSPVISPSGFVIHDGRSIPAWAGSGLIGGLSSTSLVRVTLGAEVREVERFDMPRRVREVELDGEGVLHVLEDKSKARLLRLEPIAD